MKLELLAMALKNPAGAGTIAYPGNSDVGSLPAETDEFDSKRELARSAVMPEGLCPGSESTCTQFESLNQQKERQQQQPQESSPPSVARPPALSVRILFVVVSI